MNFGRIMVFRAPPGEGDGGTPPAPPSPAGGGTPPAPPSPDGGGQSQGGGDGRPAPVVPYRPEGLPDDFYGASDKETIDKLYGQTTSLRTAIGKFGELGKLPAKAEDYAFEPSEKARPFLPGIADDPVMKIVREAAFASGIRDKQFAPFLSKVMDAMVDGDLVVPAIDVAAETAKLVPAEAAGLDDAGKAAAVDRRVRDNHAMIQAWKGQGLPDEAAAQLALTLDTAASNHAIEWFAKQLRTPQPAPGGSGQQGGVTKAQIEERQRDPRHKVGSDKYDAAFVTETNNMWKNLFPGS